MTATRIDLVPTDSGWKRPDCGCHYNFWDGPPIRISWYEGTYTPAPNMRRRRRKVSRESWEFTETEYEAAQRKLIKEMEPHLKVMMGWRTSSTIVQRLDARVYFERLLAWAKEQP